jgi:hypothetical protein
MALSAANAEWKGACGAVATGLLEAHRATASGVPAVEMVIRQ